jgi:hypothetical protein
MPTALLDFPAPEIQSQVDASDSTPPEVEATEQRSLISAEKNLADMTIVSKIISAHLSGSLQDQAHNIEKIEQMFQPSSLQQRRATTSEHVSSSLNKGSLLDTLVSHHRHLDIDVSSTSDKWRLDRLVEAKLLASYESTLSSTDEPEVKMHISYEILLSHQHLPSGLESKHFETKTLYRAEKHESNPEVQTWKDRANLFEVQAKHFEEQYKLLEEKVEKLERMSTSRKETIGKLEHKLGTMKPVKAELKDKKILVRAYKVETDIQEANVDRLGDSVEAAIIAITELEEQNNALKTRRSNLEAEKSALEIRVNTLGERNQLLETQVNELLELEPLVESGVMISDRKYERTKKNKQDQGIIRQGDHLAHFGTAWAEAVLFLGKPSRPPLDDDRQAYFLERYGFSVAVVYSHRHSSTLIAICDSHCGMHGYQSPTHDDSQLRYLPFFESFHSKITEWLSENGTEGALLPGKALEAFIESDPDLPLLAAKMQSIADDAYSKHKDARDVEKARTRQL